MDTGNYMANQMDNLIQSGINERDFMIERIDFLEKQNSEILKSLTEILRFKHELKSVMGEKLASPENFLKTIENAEQVIKKATEL